MKLNALLTRLPLAAAVFLLLPLAALPAAVHGAATEITFASGPDDSGTIGRIIDTFNARYEGRVHVTWRVMDRINNVHHQQLVEALAAGKDTPHVFASDVIWTAQFARNGWVKDLTEPFYRSYDREDFLGPALESATDQLRIRGVPWYTDAGILYYRRDLLAKSGYDTPPRTWDELVEMSRKVMRDSGIRHGFVFQGAEYEGGTVNAAEFIWGAGGELMHGELSVTSHLRGTVAETDSVTVATDEAASGLDAARRLVTEGITPAEVTTFRDKEALDLFLAGDAVFLRSWPYVYGTLGESTLDESQVGISALPALSTNHVGYSCLGGWNLMISARAGKDEEAAAWQFIRHLTSSEQQSRQALQAGLLPVLETLYKDPEIVGQSPVMELAGKTISSRVRERPVSPFYHELSSRIASAFQRVVNGEITGTAAVEMLDGELRAISIRNSQAAQ